MTLTQADPTSSHLQVAQAGLNTFVQLRRVPSDLTIDPTPQPVFVVTLRPNPEGEGFGAELRHVAWRYFASNLSLNVVSIEVSIASPPVIDRLQYGEPAKQALEALEKVRVISHPGAQRMELRLLRVPGSLAEALWVKPSDKDKGVVFPVKTFDLMRLRYKPQSFDEFIDTLQPVKNKVPTPEERRARSTKYHSSQL